MSLKKIISIFICLSSITFANENKEINIYTSYKYKSDYSKLSKEQQDKVSNEYNEVEKLSKVISKELDKSLEYKVMNQINGIQIWSQQFMKNYNPSKDEINKLYDEKKLMKSSEYKLLTLTVKDEKTAKSIQEEIKSKKDLKDKLKLFEKFVKEKSIDTVTKNNNGNLGWIKTINLQAKIKEAVKQSKKGDYIAIKTDKFYQILLVEDFKEAEKLSFEEAKPTLEMIAKREALEQKIKELIK